MLMQAIGEYGAWLVYWIFSGYDVVSCAMSAEFKSVCEAVGIAEVYFNSFIGLSPLFEFLRDVVFFMISFQIVIWFIIFFRWVLSWIPGMNTASKT